MITPETDDVDVQVPLLTVKVYEPGAKLLKVVDVPVPVADPEGVPIIVHVPEDGRPVNSILPVAVEQVVCVIAPKTGAVGTIGAVFIDAEVEATELQEPLLTVKV